MHTQKSTRIHFSLSDWAWRFCLLDKQGHGRQTTRQQFRAMAQTAANRFETTAAGSLLRYVHTLQSNLRGCPRWQGLRWCVSIWIRNVRPESRERAVKFFARQGVVFSFKTYTHTHTHIQITRGVSVPLSVARERHPWITCTVGKTHYHAQRTESK